MTPAADDGESRPPRGATPRRLVLLGASNLAMGIGTVVDCGAAAFGRPVEVLAAFGHGRSYGRASRVLGRELPGILECGLWANLAESQDRPTAALVTDIGNDLLYEEPVARIAGWVEDCFDRLCAAEAETLVALLPLDNLHRLSAARFYLFRTLLFPPCRLTFADALSRAHELDEHVRRLAQTRGLTMIRPRAHWYGWDPIHFRIGRRRRAWRELLSSWAGGDALAKPPRGALARTLYLQTRTPERRRLLGFEQRGRQPAARLGDGTTVAIY